MARNEAEFVHRENIKHLEEQITREMNPAARALLQIRLDEERTKLRNIINRPETDSLN